MPARIIETNEQALEEAADLQRKSRDAALRMQRRLQETEAMGVMTLDDLYERRRQIDALKAATDGIQETLEETEHLQGKMEGFWGWLVPRPSSVYRPKIVPSSMGDSNAAVSPTIIGRSKGKKLWKKLGARGLQSHRVQSQNQLEPPPGETAGPEYQKQLQALDEGDEELDRQLDDIGRQLENVTRMAQEMGEETKQQGQKMKQVGRDMSNINARQQKAIERTQKFLGDPANCKPQKSESILPKLSWF